MPICTVLLITYNHAPFIAKCIESVLAQKTKYPFIIKIFDDASTDGSTEIILEYAQKYPDKIKAFIAPKNQGAQTNIWNAYKSVDTKYCILTETDDYWCDEQKLELQITALENHPECSFAAHNTKIINLNDKYRKEENESIIVIDEKIREKSIVSIDDIKKSEGGYIVFVSSRLLRTSAIDLENVKNKEDFLYDNCQFFYLILKGNMYYFDKVMSIYNQHAQGSFSGIMCEKKIRIHVKNLLTFNENTDYIIEEVIYRHIAQFINYWLYLNTKYQNKHSPFFKKLKQLKHYFIPRAILDIFNIPRYIGKFIKNNLYLQMKGKI